MIDKLITTGVACYAETSILVAKVRALRDVVSSAVQAEFNKIIVECDNEISINIEDIRASLSQGTH